MDNTMVEIQKADGTIENVTLVTYLISNDGLSQYIIYTKNETDDKGLVTVYVSSVDRSSGETKLYGINDDDEWNKIKDVLRELSKTE